MRITRAVAAIAAAAALCTWGVPPALADEGSDTPVAVVETAPEPVVEPAPEPGPAPEPVVEEPAPVVVEEVAPEPAPEPAPETARVQDEQSTPQPSPTQTQPPHEEHKVVVCKYVSKPGENERLQTGQNPITPDENSIPWFHADGDVVFPQEFVDGQNRSVAVRYLMDGEKPSDPTLADCPRPPQPEGLEGSIPGDETLCVEPLDGTAHTRTSTQAWVQPYVWDGFGWVLGEQVFGPVVWSDFGESFPDEGCLPDMPEPLVVTTHTDWLDGVWACGDTDVTQTRTEIVTTTPYMWDGEAWVLDTENTTAVETQQTQTRALTQEEIGTCPLLPGAIRSVCVGDIPYLSYGVTLPEGFEPDSANPVTITFHKDGNTYTLPGTYPLSGTVLWPGANVSPPQWPGWTLDGTATTDDPARFGWTRTGVTVTFEVNPTYSTVVAYPAATEACANPPAVTPVSSPTPTLASTGSDGVVGYGLAALVMTTLGTGLALARRRYSLR